MNGLRTRALGAAFLAGWVLVPGTAWAQPSGGFATGAPQTLSGPPPNAPEVLIRAGAVTSAVTVNSLGAVEGPPAGTISADQGGVGASLWLGAPKLEAEALLDRLPIATTIAPLRALARRLLLTTAAAPIGQAPHAFATVRLRRLLDAGLLGDAGALARVAEVPHDPDFDRARADALLYANQTQAVCGPDTSRRLRSSEPFWIRLRAYCYSVQGNLPAAQLTLSVMQAQGLADPGFNGLLAGLRQRSLPMPKKIVNADALTVFLLQQNSLPVPLDLGEELGTPGLLLAAQAAKNPPGDRIAAAERVLRTGALSVSELRAIADAQNFSPDQLATEHAQVLQLPFLEGQALLRRAVKKASEEAQPALIFEALATARKQDLMGVAADLEQGALMRVMPTARDHRMTDLFARALMMTGNVDRAADWAATLDLSNPGDAMLWAHLYACLELIAPASVAPGQRAAMLSELRRELVHGAPGQRFAALALGLFNVLKEPLPPAVALTARRALATTWPGRRPGRVYMHKLTEAMRTSGQRGIAIAFILDALGAQGPGDLTPNSCVSLVGDLVREHLGADARAIGGAALLNYRAPRLEGAARQVKGAASL